MPPCMDSGTLGERPFEHANGIQLPLSTLSVNGHLFLPIRGHDFSPLVAMVSPHWWPSNLPTIRDARAWSGQGLDPLAGGRLSEPVAVLAFGDDHVGMVE